MDKTRYELLQEAAIQKGYTGILIDENGEIALEAMKIFGEQAFNHARLQVGQPDFAQYLYENFSEYIELLEEKK